MEPFEDERIATALESLRPTPDPVFAAELDERAAAGFPRPSGAHVSPLRRLRTRLEAAQPRRVLIPAAGTALAAIAAVTVVVAVGKGGDSSRLSLGRAESAGTANEATRPPAARTPEIGQGGVAGTEYIAPVPAAKAASGEAISGANGGIGAGAADASAPATSGPFASEARHREVERSAEIVLGTDDVPDAAAKVFDAVHAYNGIVLSSSVSGGAEGDAGAEFDLLIPSAKLGDALAAFSGVAEVLSRHEATADITAPTVRAGERLRDSRATIDGLLVQLAGADSDAERAEVEAELRSERRHAAALRSSLKKLDRRANLSRVSLRIESGSNSSPNGSGGWGVDDALGDAGHILGIAAGVTLVGLAILAPLALIGLLIWLANRARLRRARERTLS